MKTTKSAPKGGDGARSASRRIGARIKELGGWRGKTLARVRKLIRQADPEVVEGWKWRGVPAWSHAGTICTGETYRDVVKLTFARGAALAAPSGLFNSSLEGNTRRVIDLHEGDVIDEKALKALVRAAAALNTSAAAGSGAAKAERPRTAAPKPPRRAAAKPELLSGGNPRIAKADGDIPVQAYIAAMPGWKKDVGRRLDALIERAVPGVRKAVKWNSPFYGVEGHGWFLAIHCFTNYVKVAFFRGASLRPPPPGESRQKDVRYLDVREGDQLDEAQLADWVWQAGRLSGWDGA